MNTVAVFAVGYSTHSIRANFYVWVYMDFKSLTDHNFPREPRRYKIIQIDILQFLKVTMLLTVEKKILAREIISIIFRKSLINFVQ